MNYERVFKFAQCVSPFCLGEGKYDDEERETCAGSGECGIDV